MSTEKGGKHAALLIHCAPGGGGREREGACVQKEGVGREYNPFVSLHLLSYGGSGKQKNLNKHNIFLSLSGASIRHRPPNLPPVCAPRNARLPAQRTTVFKQRAPSRDPQGGGPPQHRAHMGGEGGGGLWPPKRTETRPPMLPQRPGDRPEK